MATGLVKWWRARFLAGYKPFSVVGGNAEGSDSEELLAGVATPCTGSPPPPAVPLATASEVNPILVSPEATHTTVEGSTPTPATTNDENPTASSTAKQLSFEEFECDVSVAEGDRRRQEFSFTLYDFDGHGKITKDDIAGLVTTIYDTLGASIQVPPCGSKTIKVKLTVSPDQRARQTRAGGGTCLHSSQTPPTTATSTLPPSCCHLKQTQTSCGHHANHGPRHRLPRRRRTARHRCQQSENPVETHSEDDAENASPNRVKQEELRRRVGPVPHLPSPYSNSSEGDISDDSDTTPAFTPLTPLLTPNQRKRSGALQRQQLLEIIQANMEKNNLSFHTSRKRHQSEQLRIPSRSPQDEPTSPYNQRCRLPSESRQPTGPAAYHKPVREATQHSVSFSKLSAKTRANMRKPRVHLPTKNATYQPPRVHVQPRVLPRTVLSPTGYGEQLPASNGNRNLLPNNNQQTIGQTAVNERNNSNVQRSDTHFMQTQQSGKPSKKHQLKHATREQDQARAMAQVVRWLEREFSQNAVAVTAGRRHVHEHIHHHYHHYHAEALV